MNKIFNPALFASLLIISVFLFLNSFFQIYLSSVNITYDKKIQAAENEINTIKSQISSANADIASYKNILSIKNKFAEMAGNNFTQSEAIKIAITIDEESKRHNIDPNLILALIETESKFKRDAVSYRGAIGIMQLLPATAFYVSSIYEHINLKHKKELFDPEINLRLGAAYFAYLVEKTGSTEHAIIAYNYGPVNLKNALKENRELPKSYIKKVMKNHRKVILL